VHRVDTPDALRADDAGRSYRCGTACELLPSWEPSFIDEKAGRAPEEQHMTIARALQRGQQATETAHRLRTEGRLGRSLAQAARTLKFTKPGLPPIYTRLDARRRRAASTRALGLRRHDRASQKNLGKKKRRQAEGRRRC